MSVHRKLDGFRETQPLRKYLGVSLLYRSLKRSIFNYILEKVKSKLTSLKSRHLYFVGRVTLSKVVIEVLHIYTIMNTIIPKAYFHEI